MANVDPARPKGDIEGGEENDLRTRSVETFRWMLLSRILEDRIASLYRSGKIVGGVYLGKGQEAFSAALGSSLDQTRGDVFGPLIRDMAGRLAFGEDLMDPLRTYLGSKEGPMRGRDGNIHRGRPKEGMPAMISHLGAMVSVVNGMLMARRFRGQSDCVGATAIGDGGTSTGAFHEAMNQAAVEKLPLVVAVANNQYAYSTSTDRQFACEDLAERAKGYGVRGYSINGTKIDECVAAFDEAVGRARAGEGPQLVVGKLLRLAGHGEHDDASYMVDDLKSGEFGRDCMESARELLLERGWISSGDIEGWSADAVEKIEAGITLISREARPDSSRENWHSISSRHLSEGSHEG